MPLADSTIGFSFRFERYGSELFFPEYIMSSCVVSMKERCAQIGLLPLSTSVKETPLSVLYSDVIWCNATVNYLMQKEARLLF